MKAFLALIFLISCSHSPIEGDRKLKQDEIPHFLTSFNTQKDVEYFEKIKESKHFYEVKYRLHNKEVSEQYSSVGAFIEKEVDLDWDDLPEVLKNRIKTYLERNYTNHKVVETERRILPGDKVLYDIEIKHSSSPSGYWELSFDEEGKFHSRELENYDHPNTLN